MPFYKKRFPRTSTLFLILAASALLAPARAQFIKPHLDKLSAVALASLSQAKPGQAFALKIRFKVGDGAWYYGPTPGGKIVSAQPAEFAPPDNAPFVFGKPVWPKTTVRIDNLGSEKDSHNVYYGAQTITVPMKVKPDAPKKSYDLVAKLSGQVCTSKTCIPLFAPVEFKIVVGNATVVNRAPFPPFPAAKEEKNKPGGVFGMTVTPPGGSKPNAPASAQIGFDVTRLKLDSPKGSWLVMLVAALIGGFILNFMPCVLPVVPVKVYTFIEHSRQDRGKTIRLSLSFGGGMLSVFLILGGIMAGARGLWGSQFQHPAFIASLGALMLMMALWLLGAFELTPPQTLAGARVSGSDYAGAFGMGALATLLATPCSGPFLGLALAWAASQPSWLILLTFTCIGAGMAFPYIALSAQPKLLSRLPRPGPWMETWKQSMALVMFGVAIYFFSLLPDALHAPFLVFCLSLGAGVWIMGRWGGLTATKARRAVSAALSLSLAVAGGWSLYDKAAHPADLSAPVAESIASNGLEWSPFDPATLNDWLRGGQTVVVEWTADWCLNCRYVENTVYRNPTVTSRLKRNVRLMRADLSHSYPAAERILQRLGGQGIPFSAVFRSDDPAHPVILRDVYTAGALLNALDGGSKVAFRE